MIGNWLSNPNGGSVGNIFPLGKPIADGTTVYKYDPLHGYSMIVFDSALGGWDPAAPMLNPGEGVIIENAASAPIEVGRWGMFATNLPYPAKVSALGLAGTNGNKIYGLDAKLQKWIVTVFDLAVGGWDPFEDTIYPGEARFMFNGNR
jgi:hypothetical protein